MPSFPCVVRGVSVDVPHGRLAFRCERMRAVSDCGEDLPFLGIGCWSRSSC